MDLHLPLLLHTVQSLLPMLLRSLQTPLSVVCTASLTIAMLIAIHAFQNSDGNVFFCTDANFSGACLLFAITNGVCFNVPNGFNDDISSFGPDAGIGCRLFM